MMKDTNAMRFEIGPIAFGDGRDGVDVVMAFVLAALLK